MIRDLSDPAGSAPPCPSLGGDAVRPDNPPLPDDPPLPDKPPLPDNPALRDLRRQVADDAAVDRFVTDFLTLLDERLGDLRRLIAAGRAEEGVTRLLSIKTSSAMVGADSLTAAAGDLIHALQQGERQLVPHHYRELLRSCEQTRRALGPPQPVPGGAPTAIQGAGA